MTSPCLTIVLLIPHQMSQNPITHPHTSFPTTTIQNQRPQQMANVQNLSTYPRSKIQNLASQYNFQQLAPWSKEAVTATAALLFWQITVLCCPVLFQRKILFAAQWACLCLVETITGPNVDPPSPPCLITRTVFWQICLKIRSCCCHENSRNVIVKLKSVVLVAGSFGGFYTNSWHNKYLQNAWDPWAFVTRWTGSSWQQRFQTSRNLVCSSVQHMVIWPF